MTTNEAFKWELVEDAIDRGDLFVQEDSDDSAPRKVKHRNKESQKEQDKKKLRRIESLEQVDNIFDRGFMRNLVEVFFPPDVIRRKKR